MILRFASPTVLALLLFTLALGGCQSEVEDAEGGDQALGANGAGDVCVGIDVLEVDEAALIAASTELFAPDRLRSGSIAVTIPGALQITRAGTAPAGMTLLGEPSVTVTPEADGKGLTVMLALVGASPAPERAAKAIYDAMQIAPRTAVSVKVKKSANGAIMCTEVGVPPEKVMHLCSIVARHQSIPDVRPVRTFVRNGCSF